MDRNKIKTLASLIYIKPSEKVIDLTLFLYQKITKGLEELDKDFNNIVNELEPLSKVNEQMFLFDNLRDDNVDNSLKLEVNAILENANKVEDDFICIKKVLND
jgi:asp-tRNAAsn/glu-tRNAGln amidotransferase C subunit